MHPKLINLDLTPDIQSFKKDNSVSVNWPFKFTASSTMANPQLGHDPDDGEPRRAKPLPKGSLWSTIEEVKRRLRRAYTKTDMGIHMLPEQAVDSEYETLPRSGQARLPESASLSKCGNSNSPSINPRCLAKDIARNDSLPNPAPRSESNMMRQPATQSISQEQLIAEVKGIYAGLVMVETKCFEVDNGQSTQGRLTPEKWQHLVALHRTLMFENCGASNLSSSPKTPHDHELGALLSEVSLRSRSFCRLSSRLQPLLQTTKGPPSCVRFVEFFQLISALSDILSKYSSLLDFTDTILTGLFDLITSIIRRLDLRFRSAYEELRCRNATTQIIFEFPNNMRHVCTTMPWTILPALLVLWGVCWMFIIGPGDVEPEKFKALVPTFSPAAAAYGFLDNSGPASYDLGLQSVLMPEPSTTGFDQHLTIDSLLFNHDSVGIDAICSVQDAPQDPDFLSLGVWQRNSVGNAETSAKEDLTGALPAAITPDPILQTSGEPDRQEPFNPMVNVASAGQGVQNTGHLRVCKHNPNVSTSSAESGGTEERSLSHLISTPALPDELQRVEPLSEGSSAESSVRKRSRSEKDDDWSEESLLREMKKKLKRMAQEVKEKEDAYLQAREGLESIQKTIQVMEDSLRKS
ncbi:hypothetical protein FCIRC_12065 [Fusarium circinatum]|uniref:Uncharacterized protein n=1 Tax=Fusarium circinatum TaxID=48490 RepID=A0A8H5WJU5_FUSCI|nr:hypothetical protein FCIRC_12065 [Fusarium circinatum]